MAATILSGWQVWHPRQDAQDDPKRLAAAPPKPLLPPGSAAIRALSPHDAKLANAALPTIGEAIAASTPFKLKAGKIDAFRATTCLAAALWYEAGDNRIDQQAVAQVVLNRLRHPSFPKSVCAVIFEGADRRTGCQFTFACDGSLARLPTTDAWKRALTVARQALSGYVVKGVGTATYYHADWIVPYWAASLDKIAQVGPHIFYRTRGAWGLPRAFSGRYQGNESIATPLLSLPRRSPIASFAVARSEPLEGEPVAGDELLGEARVNLPIIQPAPPTAKLRGNVLRYWDEGTGQYVLQLDPKAFAGSYALVAYDLCHSHAECNVFGWVDDQSLPNSVAAAAKTARTASFVYRKIAAGQADVVQWDCRRFTRPNADQCLPGTLTPGLGDGPVRAEAQISGR